MAVALGIGAAVAGGTAIAGADTPPGNAADDPAAQSSKQSPTGEDTATDSTATRWRGRQATNYTRQGAQNEASDNTSAPANRHARAGNGPGSVPSISLEGVDDPTVDAARADLEEASAGEKRTSALAATTPVAVSVASPTTTPESRSARTGGSPAAPGLVVLDVLQPPGQEIPSTSATSTIATIDPAVPSPTDQVTTEYGDIGKWMLQGNGEIADYGGLPYEGKTVLEPVNVIIVDPSSKTALEAAWRLNVAMRRSGFPPRLIHSTGFRGLIDDQRYRQQPRGLLVGYSDDFFLLPNNHGRIFGPDPVETSSGYVWSGAFSTEELALDQGLPRHAYVSSNVARDALARQLVASGQARLGGTVSLDNSYNTDTTTTGDHDGYAVVIILNDRNVFGAATNAEMRVGGAAANNRICVAAGSSPAWSANAPCATVAVIIHRPGPR